MLEEKILNQYKEAMKTRDSVKSSTLSFLRAEIINAAVAKKKNALDDDEILSVVRKQIKAHQDSIEQFTKGNRLDLVGKEEKELEILKTYLPPELPLDETTKIVEEAVSRTGAQEIKDMGKVMKEVQGKIAGRADAKLVSDLVKERLSRG